ncbi:MAG: hypothetical protein NT034_02670 [Candidatus Magasanikbacteria bacterium]|nr:hypothetical protein [Candidatus Magasanikbacteria bacterium]
MDLHSIDIKFINFAKKISVPFARLSIFVVFFWFGVLKVLGYSPASGLVKDLLSHTLGFVNPDNFVVWFGVFEMMIGVLFLIKGLERLVIPLLLLHMVTTIMPLFLLPSAMWSHFFVPTLEGQYIIKNMVIIAASIGIAAHLHPLKK